MTGPALFIYLLMYIICPYFVHSLIEFHFYAFYSSLSLKQAVVWRARMEKHNHGALWLIMDLHNSLWISTDDLWISIVELWASIIGFMEIHYSNYGAPYHSIYEDPQSTIRFMELYNLLLWSSERFVEIHHPHDEAPWYTYHMELHDWNVDGVS